MSRFSPASSPRVTDEPISFGGVISNINDGMVGPILGTRVIFKDSTCIVSEVVVDIEMSGMRSVIVDRLGKGFSAFNETINGIVVRDGGSYHGVVKLALS